MKALTYNQPHATLAALGYKKLETRSRRTHYRGQFAIHAGKKVDRVACEREPIKSILAKHGYTADNLPTGAVIAIAEIVDSKEIIIDDDGDARLMRDGIPIEFVGKGTNEFEFGYYSDGRHAWEMSKPRPIEPIAVKGQQGWWNWESEHNEKNN